MFHGGLLWHWTEPAFLWSLAFLQWAKWVLFGWNALHESSSSQPCLLKEAKRNLKCPIVQGVIVWASVSLKCYLIQANFNKNNLTDLLNPLLSVLNVRRCLFSGCWEFISSPAFFIILRVRWLNCILRWFELLVYLMEETSGETNLK